MNDLDEVNVDEKTWCYVMLCDVMLETEALGSNSFWMKDLFIEDFFDQQTISLGKENVFGKLGNGNGIGKVDWMELLLLVELWTVNGMIVVN